MDEQTIGFVIALIIAPVVGWPVWLVLLAIKRAFDAKTDADDFTALTPEEGVGSLIETLGEVGYTLASKVEALSQKGKRNE